jgi:hypothetical protein
MSWKCLQCGEVSDDQYEMCWHCGTASDGQSDPEFQHADDYEPPLPEDEKAQFPLSFLLSLVTAFCLIFGLVAAVVSGQLTFWNVVVSLAGLAALSFVVLLVLTALFMRFVNQWRRDLRDDVHRNRPPRSRR